MYAHSLSLSHDICNVRTDIEIIDNVINVYAKYCFYNDVDERVISMSFRSDIIIYTRRYRITARAVEIPNPLTVLPPSLATCRCIINQTRITSCASRDH